MEPHELDRLYERARLVLSIGGEEVSLGLGATDPRLDAWLAERGHGTCVFLPAHDPGVEGAQARTAREDLDAALAAEPGRQAGELVIEGAPAPVPGWWVSGGTRAGAREVAAALKVRGFFWVQAGSPLELHATKGLDEEFFDGDDQTWYRTSRAGLLDLGSHVLAFLERPRQALGPVRAAVGIVLALVTLAVLSGASFLTSLPALEAQVPVAEVPAPAVDEIAGETAPVGDGGAEADDGEDVAYRFGSLPRWLLHPAWIPALLLGLLLRSRRPGDGERELTAAESERAWVAYAPRLALVWTVAAVAVLALHLARAAGQGDVDLDLLERWGRSFSICLWVLPAIAYSRDLEEGFERAIEAFFAGMVAVIVLHFVLAVAGWGTRLALELVDHVVPDIPRWIEVTCEVVAKLAAEGLFLSLMLGYTWSIQRERFVRWASGEE